MSYNHQKALFCFRQDLRIQDNKWLSFALENAKEVIPVFIFDKKTLQRFSKGKRRIWFLMDAVKKLAKEIKERGGELYVFHDQAEELIPRLIKKYHIDAYYYNASYGRWSKDRDQKIEEWCEENTVSYKCFHDYLIHEPSSIEQRKVFTPFYKLRRNKTTKEDLKDYTSEKNNRWRLSEYKGIDHHIAQVDHEENIYRPVDAISERLEKDYQYYQTQRNIPSCDETTKLSPYLRFGLISARQVMRRCGKFIREDGTQVEIKNGKRQLIKNHPYAIIISELARREFRQHIAHYFPETASLEFQWKRRYIQREKNEEKLNARKEGRTGYPIVDAAMKQLKEENRMHGRTRMVVASFLTKDLLIDRREGEAHFADYLIDYDRNINIGNRQRSASVWADPKPLRIFNPILQSQRFDPDCKYIFKYLPELKSESPKAIHDPIKQRLFNYHTPIVDHYVWSKKAKERYNQSRDMFEEGKIWQEV